MDGCPKHNINRDKMNKMLNWDIYTHPKSKEFSLNTSVDEKYVPSLEWKNYMEETNSWISFYVWTSCDGSKLETNTTFPPYKGIMLGEASNSSKAIPLVLKDDLALGIDGRIHKASEQINWKNKTIKGLEMNMVKNSEQKECFDSLSIIVHIVNKTLNDVNFLVYVLKAFVRESTTQIEIMERKVYYEFKST